MRKKSPLIVLALLLCQLFWISSESTDILVLADIHLDLFYKPDASPASSCRDSQQKAEVQAPLGRDGCDTPLPLLELVLQHAAKEVTPKYIIMNGDSVAHTVARQYGKETVMETHQIVFDLVTSFFPEAIILPSIGNNDVYRHNNVPRRNEADEYYGSLFDIWFSGTSVSHKNRFVLSQEEEQNMKRGGFYAMQIAQNLTVLGLNSIFYQVGNRKSNDPNGAQEQLEWIENTLQKAPEGMQFIPFYHVNVGTDTFGNHQWQKEYVAQYLKIQQKYQDKILIDWVAHIHQATFRGYEDTKNGVVYGGALHSPAVTPVYHNNPGFRIYTLETEEDATSIAGYRDFALQLEELSAPQPGTLQVQNQKQAWNAQYTSANLGIQDFSPEGIQAYWKRVLGAPDALDLYMLQSGGYDASQLEDVKESYISMFDMHFPTSMNANWEFYCRMMSPGYDNFSYCLERPPSP